MLAAIPTPREITISELLMSANEWLGDHEKPFVLFHGQGYLYLRNVVDDAIIRQLRAQQRGDVSDTSPTGPG